MKSKEALRFNSGKPLFSSAHPIIGQAVNWDGLLLEAFADVAEYGHAKYDSVAGTRCNYMLGGKNCIEYLDSALRHLHKLLGGEECDRESGKRHAHHLVWNLVVFLAFTEHKKCEPIIVPEHIAVSEVTECTYLFAYLHQACFLATQEQQREVVYNTLCNIRKTWLLPEKGEKWLK